MTAIQQSYLKGIGGWLLFLCISLTIFTPFAILAAISSTSAFAETIAERFPYYVRLVTVSQFIHFGFLCYSVYVGVNLWKTKKGAVNKAQMFFVSYLVFALFRVLMPFLGELPLIVRDQLVDIYGRNALRIFVYALIWHQYLARSVRVKNTFLS